MTKAEYPADWEHKYTDPALRARLKDAVVAGDKGGKPGQWSARKAQLLKQEYERAGGGYLGEKGRHPAAPDGVDPRGMADLRRRRACPHRRAGREGRGCEALPAEGGVGPPVGRGEAGDGCREGRGQPSRGAVRA